jgi:hypothetical protein
MDDAPRELASIGIGVYNTGVSEAVVEAGAGMVGARYGRSYSVKSYSRA